MVRFFESSNSLDLGSYNQGWKYWFIRIYRYLDFIDISDISEIYQWIFLHEYRYIIN